LKFWEIKENIANKLIENRESGENTMRRGAGGGGKN